MAATAGSTTDIAGLNDTDTKKKVAGTKPRGSQGNLHGSGVNLAHESEAKKKIAALNAMDKKRASLDVRHRYLLEKFAYYCDEKPAVLETSLLIGNKLEVLNEFFAEGGVRKVLFFWQKVPYS